MEESRLNLARHVLEWGSLDVKFLEDKINEFNICPYDIRDYIESFEGNIYNINNWIYSIFNIAGNRFLEKVQVYADENGIEFNRDKIDIEVFCNYLDSFIDGSHLNSFDIDISNYSDENIEYYLNWLKERNV